MISKTFVYKVKSDVDGHGADYGIPLIKVPYDIIEELVKQGLKPGDEVQITIFK